MIVYRRGIPIDACSTLGATSVALGGCRDLLRKHKRVGTHGFPKPVAKVGPFTLYVTAELESFYRSVLWRQADRHINELRGGGAA